MPGVWRDSEDSGWDTGHRFRSSGWGVWKGTPSSVLNVGPSVASSLLCGPED